MSIGMFTNSTFNGIPPLKYLISYFYSLCGQKVQVYHAEVRGLSVFKEQETQIYPLAVFESTAATLQQGGFTKIKRHLSLLYRIFQFQSTNKRSVLYCIDFATCNLLLISQLLFFFQRNKVIYHQFEMYDPARASKFDKINFWIFKKLASRLSLVIMPEINRLTYFKQSTGIPGSIPTFIFPNTNSDKADFIPAANRVTQKENIVIGHIGSLGTEQHFIKQYVEVLRKLPPNFKSLFAGRITPEVKSMLKELGNRVQIIDHVLQHELKNVYASIDIGIILYHPYELNTRYAAPTKMYEYWSCGVPVIAHKLISLEPLFINSIQGTLTDLSNPDVLYNELINLSKQLETWDRNSLRQHFKDNFELNKFISGLDSIVRKTI
ncbi:glycosyltransferase family 4 protein [Niastella caeni]|uniref:Glycosyltransferase family 4 protein n=1 Tax=Niastella caeni TaxID=2569763 RepID=A0A4S8I4H5_9BACT|nr:glycosyltransferase [Niastella caeni]THU41512.1 glycosyltransferase family 4 protein [Niastella caeni]